MRDQQHLLAVVPLRKLGEELASLIEHLAVALAAWERAVDVSRARLERGDRRTVQLAVVAFPQPRVLQLRDVRAGEGDLDRLDRPAQVGAEDHVDVATSLTQVQCESTALSGQLAG